MNGFADDFFRGMRDCDNGEQHKVGQSEAYDRGYSAQYEFEQIKSAQGESNEARRANQTA